MALKNKHIFHFADFTLRNYQKILTLALEKYDFIDFFSKAIKRSIILRHDIEFSIPIAEKMARIEHELGIKATFFLQLHSEFYNAFDKDSFNTINQILDGGHSLGLHFDAHFWNIQTEDQLEKFLIMDKDILEKYLGREIKIFSFHNTNDFILSCDAEKYAGMVNVYSKHFKEKVGYLSDSTGYWRFERLEDRLKEAKNETLQILIHDGMWQEVVLPPRQRIFKVFDDRARFLKDFYDTTLKKFGAQNVDWEEVL